jgi:hypothetical protein
MECFGGPKRSQWEGMIQKDSEKTKDDSKFAEATKEDHNGLSRQRKGKNSKYSKLSEIGIIAKCASQYFQRCKRIVKQSYKSKDIHGQSFGKPSPVNRDESACVLLTSTSVRMMSPSI